MSNNMLRQFGVLVFIGIVTSFSILSLRSYVYPASDVSYYMPIFKPLINPELYPNDILRLQFSAYPSAIWLLLSGIISLTHAEVSTIFFVLYAISLYLIFLGTYMLSISLFRDVKVAVLSVYLLLFCQLEFAGTAILENAFVFRTVGLAICIFSFYSFFNKYFLTAYVLTAITFVFHPLTGIFSTVMIGITSLYLYKAIGWKKLLYGLALFAVISSPIFLLKLTGSGSGILHVDSSWLDVMYLRSAHHIFPGAWDRFDILSAIFTIIVLIISLKHGDKRDFQFKAMQIFIMSTLLMAIVGVIFSEFIPIKIVIQLQFLRSIVLLFYFVPIFFAHYYIQELSQSQKRVDSLHLIILLVFVFNLYTILGSTIFSLVGFVTLALAIVVRHSWQIVPLRAISPLLSQRLVSNAFVSLLVVSVVMIGSYGYLRKGGFTIENSKDTNWLDVQLWAKNNSELDAMFIVPPQIEGFRIESERTTYVSWKDGTLFFFDEGYGDIWLERLSKLGFEPTYVNGHMQPLSFADASTILDSSYRELDRERISAIANTLDECNVYFVTFMDVEEFDIPPLYVNEGFRVYDVSTCSS